MYFKKIDHLANTKLTNTQRPSDPQYNPPREEEADQPITDENYINNVISSIEAQNHQSNNNGIIDTDPEWRFISRDTDYESERLLQLPSSTRDGKIPVWTLKALDVTGDGRFRQEDLMELTGTNVLDADSFRNAIEAFGVQEFNDRVEALWSEVGIGALNTEFEYSEEIVLQDFAELDSNSDGVLNSQDFQNDGSLSNVRLAEDSVFKLYDFNGDGYLSHLEAKVFMDPESQQSRAFYINDHFDINDGEAVASFARFDLDGNGVVSIIERDTKLDEMKEQTFDLALESIIEWANLSGLGPRYTQAINKIQDNIKWKGDKDNYAQLMVNANHELWINVSKENPGQLGALNQFELAASVLHELTHLAESMYPHVRYNHTYNGTNNCADSETYAHLYEVYFLDWAGVQVPEPEDSYLYSHDLLTFFRERKNAIDFSAGNYVVELNAYLDENFCEVNK